MDANFINNTVLVNLNICDTSGKKFQTVAENVLLTAIVWEYGI